MKKTNKRPIIIVTITTILLLIPLIAMQFSNEVNWKLSDFIIAGALLLGTGFLIDFFLRRIKNVKYRFVIVLALLVVLLLVWAELAVGVFGTPFSGS